MVEGMCAKTYRFEGKDLQAHRAAPGIAGDARRANPQTHEGRLRLPEYSDIVLPLPVIPKGMAVFLWSRVCAHHQTMRNVALPLGEQAAKPTERALASPSGRGGRAKRGRRGIPKHSNPAAKPSQSPAVTALPKGEPRVHTDKQDDRKFCGRLAVFPL